MQTDTTPFSFIATQSEFHGTKLQFADVEVPENNFDRRKLPAIIVRVSIVVMLIILSYTYPALVETLSANFDSFKMAHANPGDHIPLELNPLYRTVELLALQAEYVLVGLILVACWYVLVALYRAHDNPVRIQKMYSAEWHHRLGL